MTIYFHIHLYYTRDVGKLALEEFVLKAIGIFKMNIFAL